MKKSIAMLLAAMMLFTNSVFAALAQELVPFGSNYFNSYGTTMSADGDGILGITFDVQGMGICSQLGVASYSVQRLNDRSNWEDVSGLLNGETGSNVASYTFSRAFYGVPGETYRVQVTFFCALNGGFEHKYYTSTGVTVD